MCNKDRNYCYDPINPCKGFFCGGSDRGVCIIDTNSQPSCECGPGFENRTFELYCCPENGGGDIDCVNAQDGGDGDDEGDSDEESDGGGDESSDGGDEGS